MKGWRLLLAAAALVTSLGAANPARAEFAEDAGWGFLTVLSNVGYMPVKTVYSLLGSLTGGLAWVCTGGDFDTASTVWSTAMGGTYVLTPSMIRGEDPIAFAGSTETGQAVSDAPAAPDAAAETPSAHGRRDEELPAS